VVKSADLGQIPEKKGRCEKRLRETITHKMDYSEFTKAELLQQIHWAKEVLFFFTHRILWSNNELEFHAMIEESGRKGEYLTPVEKEIYEMILIVKELQAASIKKSEAKVESS
jgi:hypothetical protein